MKKKILCLIDGLGSGGAERQLVGLAKLLKEDDYVVHVAYYVNKNFYSEYLNENNIIYKNISSSNKKLGKLLAVRNLVKRECYDVIISYKDGANALACLLKILGCHFMLVVSERIVTQDLTVIDKIKYFLYMLSDHVVPNSYSQEKFILNNCSWLTNKIITITNFTDLDYFFPVNKSNNSPLVVLTVARIAEQKNVMAYLEAIKIVKESGIKVLFKWFGNVEIGQDDYWIKCKNAVKKLGIDDFIDFYPATKEILAEYQKCDIFCLPSLYEGFPNVVCEAMSCGKPILCSEVCDNPSIIDDNNNGYLFNPRETEDIAKKIIMICKLTDEQRLAMGERSRYLAESKFSKELFVSKYINIIESK